MSTTAATIAEAMNTRERVMGPLFGEHRRAPPENNSRSREGNSLDGERGRGRSPRRECTRRVLRAGNRHHPGPLPAERKQRGDSRQRWTHVDGQVERGCEGRALRGSDDGLAAVFFGMSGQALTGKQEDQGDHGCHGPEERSHPR